MTNHSSGKLNSFSKSCMFHVLTSAKQRCCLARFHLYWDHPLPKDFPLSSDFSSSQQSECKWKKSLLAVNEFAYKSLTRTMYFSNKYVWCIYKCEIFHCLICNLKYSQFSWRCGRGKFGQEHKIYVSKGENIHGSSNEAECRLLGQSLGEYWAME